MVALLILPTQNPVIFIHFFLEKYTFAAISEEEKVSCFSMKSDKNYETKTTRLATFFEHSPKTISLTENRQG